ncbi:MAG: TIGR03668 family PPOX class F420-dependent oxidoreductase [Candidatus Dormibacteraceae bacterium]
MPSMTKARRQELLKVAPVAHLATVGPDGLPELVPICFALLDDTIWTAVDQKPKRTQELRRLENIRREPRVRMLIDRYDDDWSQLWWIRLQGEASIVASRARPIAALCQKYPPYALDPPTGAVIEIKITAWSSWSAT